MAPLRDRRTGFSRRRQYGLFLGYVLAIAGAVVGAALLVLSTFDPPAFAALRMAAAGVTTPLSSAAAGIGHGIASIPAGITDHFRVRSENAALRARLERSQRLVLRARTIAYDNRRLRTLLRVRDRTAGVVVTARLVSSTASSARRFALLNAGRWQGVQSGMPVVGADGLIGRIVETGPNAARVLLLSDVESIVPVRRARDGLPAVATGRGDGTVEIRSVDTADVRFVVGDLFVTTGTGGLYAPGVPVAQVVSAGRDQVAARTFARPDTLDFAIVTQPFTPMPAPVSVPGLPR
ncbi:rod shape-determining protein MreC [Sphingomonas sp.]|jgi:rod shape-determining protein MreC|uniref:rod shape-determining protein MreC n=1 Tax=Sphingomonas sp. TaxID=28214 RepID=UPI002ED9E22F